MRIEVEHAAGHVSENVRVGDEFALHGTARVVGIRDELLDVSSLQSRQVVPGERIVTLSVVISKDPA